MLTDKGAAPPVIGLGRVFIGAAGAILYAMLGDLSGPTAATALAAFPPALALAPLLPARAAS